MMVDKILYSHHASINPMVVYVPLVMQNVAKYRAWTLVWAVRRIL
jgi:hypothetical protein